MDEDAALTEQSPRQSLQEDRTPETEFMAIEQEDISLQEDIPIEPQDMMLEIEDVDDIQSNGDMNFIFDGLLEAMRRRNLNV